MDRVKTHILPRERRGNGGTMMRGLALSASAFALTSASFGLVATAQDTGAEIVEEGAETSDPRVMDSITVTARKRAESLQNVPISVTAFGEADLEKRDITRLDGISAYTPNLELNAGRPDGGGTSASIFIRGVGQYDFLFPNDPGVGLYVDDVYLARTIGGMLSLAEIERVEVLRGPQGTLYGKNTIGGAVKVITKQPELGELSGKLKGTIGNFNRGDFVGSLNFPIGDKAAALIEVGSFQRDGFIERPFDGKDLGNENRDNVRASLKYEPTENLTFRLSGDWQTQRQNQGPGILAAVVPSTAAATPIFDGQGNPVIDPVTNQQAFVPGTGLVETLWNPLVAPFWVDQLGLEPGTIFDERWLSPDRSQNFGTGPVEDDNDIWGVALTTEYDVSDSLQLKAIVSHRQLQALFSRDSDGSPLPHTQNREFFDQEQTSAELQLIGSSFDDKLEWVTGIYLFREEADSANDVTILGGTFDVVGFEIDLIPLANIEVDSYAGFAHGVYHLTDKLSVTGGVRYTYEEKKLERDFRLTQSGQIITIRADGIPDSGDPLAPIGPPLVNDWSAWSPKFGVDYQATDDLLLYFSASRGFKSGGWSPRPQLGTENTPFDQEFLNSFEIGAKSQWFNRRLTANGAVFFNTYEDIQVTTVQPDPSGSGALILPVSNAGEAEIKGLELELSARPTPDWYLELALGLLDTEYTELDPSTGIQPDAKLIDAPESTLTASAERTFALGNWGDLIVRGGASYKGKTYKDAFNTQPLTQDGYWLYDASIALEMHDGDWRLALTGTNLSDEVYITNGVQAEALGLFDAYLGRPREVALTLTHRF